MVDYNMSLLNRRHLAAAFFHLDRGDPTRGFELDASRVCGHAFPAAHARSGRLPPSSAASAEEDDDRASRYLRLVLGSHLAQHVRHQLEEQKGYTATAGIGTNKLLSKLVGNLHKPNGQTTLLPPYTAEDVHDDGAVAQLLDTLEIGKIPGVGWKMARKIREHVGRCSAAIHDDGRMSDEVEEPLTVRDVRLHGRIGPESLARVLGGGGGAPRGIGDRVWALIHGVDDSEVAQAKNVPQQISIVGHPFRR